MELINGKQLAEGIKQELRKKISSESTFKLAGILVGNDAASRKFLELKKQACEELGIKFELMEWSDTISQAELVGKMKEVALDSSVSGIVLELPLPGEFSVQQVLAEIPLQKDVDLLSLIAQAHFFNGKDGLLPPTVQAIQWILEQYHVSPRGRHCVVFGYGFLVGKPIAHWLMREGGTVTVVNEFTENSAEYLGSADVLIAGVGKAGLIDSIKIKDGALVIDFGYQNIDGKIHGDVDLSNSQDKSLIVTPVPGGVGPLVIAAVIHNLLLLNK